MRQLYFHFIFPMPIKKRFNKSRVLRLTYKGIEKLDIKVEFKSLIIIMLLLYNIFFIPLIQRFCPRLN
jgi:hypothetical protein